MPDVKIVIKKNDIIANCWKKQKTELLQHKNNFTQWQI